MEVAFVVAAAAFCVVTGANDGAALVALSGRLAPRFLLPTIGILTLAVALVPLVTTAVAATFVHRLVDLGGDESGLGGPVAVTSALLVVAWLVRRGAPTSLTLALVGALAGAAAGLGQPVSWGTLGAVLLVAASAPVVAAAIASAVLWSTSLLRPRRPLAPRLWWAHRAAFALQAGAYASNDGQKMVAVASIALPSVIEVDGPPLLALVVVAALFLLGVLAGLRSVGGTLANGVLSVRPVGIVTSEAAAGLAVIGSAALAAPVSMTQAVAGALLGSDLHRSYRGVRWQQMRRLAEAWALTLPLAFVVAAALTAALSPVVERLG